MVRTPKGIRQVNEKLIQKGRAIIITDEDFESYNWDQLPNGTLHVDTDTGIIMVKLKGESSWVPTGIKNDGTLAISRDSKVQEEMFKIIEPKNGDGTFTYENSRGERRTKPVTEEGFVFELDNGSYLMGRNYLEVILDNVLYRSVLNGGVTEITDKKFRVNEKLEKGQVVVARYIEWLRIGNPYPRFFLNSEEPAGAEIGDIWIDPEGTDPDVEENLPKPDPVPGPDSGSGDGGSSGTINNKVLWQNVMNTPKTLSGYGIVDKVSKEGHTHRVADIKDFPSTMTAAGGNADTVANKKPGINPGDLVVLDSRGQIDGKYIPKELFETGPKFIISETRPSKAEIGTIWFCTSKDFAHIECNTAGGWIPFGAVWK